MVLFNDLARERYLQKQKNCCIIRAVYLKGASAAGNFRRREPPSCLRMRRREGSGSMAKKNSERERLLADMREAGNQPTGFKGWFKNVFVYHYLKFVLIGIAALIIVGIFIHDMTKDTSPDFTLTAVSLNFANEEGKAAVQSRLVSELGDLNGNGETRIDIQDYAVMSAEGTSDLAYMIQTLQTSFVADPSSVLYVIHEDMKNYFDPDASYFPVSDFGIESDETYFVSAAGCEAIEQMFPEEGASKYYFAFKACQESKRNEPEYAAYYDAAVAAYNVLTSGS